MLWYIFVAIIVAVDQITKFFINRDIEYRGMKTVINDVFYLTHYENRGIAFSMFEGKRFILVPLSIFFLIIVGYYMNKTRSTLAKVSLLFILGGAIGNLIDRIVKGSVTDFLEFHFGSHISPILNIADIFVVVGTLMLMYYFIFMSDLKNIN